MINQQMREEGEIVYYYSEHSNEIVKCMVGDSDGQGINDVLLTCSLLRNVDDEWVSYSDNGRTEFFLVSLYSSKSECKKNVMEALTSHIDRFKGYIKSAEQSIEYQKTVIEAQEAIIRRYEGIINKICRL